LQSRPSHISRPGFLLLALALAILLLDLVSWAKFGSHLPAVLEKVYHNDNRDFRHLNEATLSHYVWEKGQVAVQDTLRIDMPELEYQAMIGEWRKTFRNDHFMGREEPWLEKKGKYKARVKHNLTDNKWHSCKLSMTGMHRDHHGDLNRFSIKLKLKGEDRLFGGKAVNLLVPESRGFIVDWCANQVFAQQFGGLEIHYTPVMVQVRKQLPVMLLREENLDKFVIEGNRRRESILFEKGYKGPLKDIEGLKAQNIDFEVNSGLDDSSRQAAILNEASRLFNQGGPELFEAIDEKLMMAALGAGLAFGSWHHLVDINLHWYYNPVNNRFEPSVREVMADPSRVYQDIGAPQAWPWKERQRHYRNYFAELHRRGFDLAPDYFAYLLKRDGELAYIKLDKALQTWATGLQRVLQDSSMQQASHQFYGYWGRKTRYVHHELLGRAQNLLQSFQTHPCPEADSVAAETITWRGRLAFDRDFVLKPHQTLIIQPGTQVLLSNNAHLIWYGEVHAMGTATQPIVIEAKEGSHSSGFMEHPQGHCEWHYVHIKGLSSFNKGIWKTPAAFTVHATPNLIMDGGWFYDNKTGDDMINLFGCQNFSMTGYRYEKTLSDAFDSDFSSGLVKACTFVQIGNDGVDGSGSTIDIINSEFDEISDKAISSGERSYFFAQGNRIRNAELVFVAKDQSVLKVAQNDFTGNKLDFAVFQKKPEYGPARIEFTGNLTHFSGLFQNGSEIQHTGPAMKTVKNVEDLLYGIVYGKATVK